MGSSASKINSRKTLAPDISSGTASSSFETEHPLQTNSFKASSTPIPHKQVDVDQATNHDKDAASPGSDDEDSGLTEDQILLSVEKSLVELNQLERPWELEGRRILTFLLKKYYKNRNKPRLVTIGDLLIKYKFLGTCVKLWDFSQAAEEEQYSYTKSKSLYTMKLILWNYTDKCPNLAKAAFDQEELVKRYMREFSMPELDVAKLTDTRKRFLIKGTLGMLLNIVRLYNPNYKLVRMDDGIANLLRYYNSKYLIIKAKVMILLAYCINEEENDKIVAGTGVIAFIVRLLGNALHSPNHIAKTHLFSATETVMGLDKLAFNDNNKKSIADAGILPLLTLMLAVSGSAEEHQAACHCIWTLSFHPENKEVILKETGLLEAVHRINADPDSDSETLRSCAGILFIVEGIETKRVESESQEEDAKQNKHIMISYQWDVQEVILQVRDKLLEQGYEVWLDVDRISGSILSAMADGIENASVVLIAMTENYKSSNPCRTEAEYAYKLSKPILPLLLQANYKPDGWLGALVGMQLYVDLSKSGPMDVQNGEMLLQQVMSKIDANSTSKKAKRMSEYVTESQTEKKVLAYEQSPTTAAPTNKAAFVPKHFSWTAVEVVEWASGAELGEMTFLQQFDGVALSQLKKLLSRSPDVYYSALRNDFKLQWLQILHFTDALEKLD